MSRLSEAMETLLPLTQPHSWDGKTWLGARNVPEIVQEALTGMADVDAMMREIAEATSLPATEQQRVQRATDMAAVELAQIPASNWPAWVVHLLQVLEPKVPEADYRLMLEALAAKIADRSRSGAW